MNRKEAVLKAAVKIFSEKGYSAATTSEIAKEAGVAEGTIFRYFKTKKDILTGVLIEVIQVFGEEMITEKLLRLIKENKDKSQREVLKLIIKDRLELINEHREEIFIILSEAKYHQDIRDAFIKNIIQRAINMSEQYVNTGIQKGDFRKVNVPVVVRSLMGIVAAYVFQEEMFPGIIGMDQDRQLDEIIDLVFYGVLKERKE